MTNKRTAFQKKKIFLKDNFKELHNSLIPCQTGLLDIIIPVGLDDDMSIKNLIENLVDLYRKTGFNKFILSGPSKGWRSVGYPPKSCFEQIADEIIECQKAVQAYGIQLGWWHTLTLKSGKSQFQRIVTIEGKDMARSACPLDPGFRKRFAADVALVAEKAKPSMIIFEDDYAINCHGGYACFCDLHLREFAERLGVYYSRKELRKQLTLNTDEAISLRLKWGELSKDSLVGFAQCVREAVDRVTPWMPIGSMQPGCADYDGDSTRAVAEALAGEHHTPFVRLYGTSYSNDDLTDLPQNIFHALYSKQHLPEKFTIYHESDTYPHNRFFMSAGKMKSLMATAYSYAFDGSIFQVRQHLDMSNEEEGYYKMFINEQPRFNAIRKITGKCVVSGCGILYDPLGFCKNMDKDNNWVRAFAHFGIPYTTNESQVNVLSGTLPEAFSDKEINAMLKNGLLIDGEAARRLCKRGFSKDIGVMVEGEYGNEIPGDICSKERIHDEFLTNNTGKLMDGCFAYSPYGNGTLFKLKPMTADTEIMTDLSDFKGKCFGIGMTRYENTQGGRVAVMAMSVKNNLSSSLFNYRRQRLIQQLIVWLGENNIVYVKERAKILCILNLPSERFRKEFLGVVTLINLSPDNCESVELRVPDKWRENCKIKYLNNEGIWENVSNEYKDESIKIIHPVSIGEPVYLMFNCI